MTSAYTFVKIFLWVSVLIVGSNWAYGYEHRHAQNQAPQEPLQVDSTEMDTANTKQDSLDDIVPYLDEVEADSGQSLVFVYMLLIILTSFMSEDLACIGAGLMVAQGLIDFWPAASACIIGILVGDYTLYLAGRWLGRSIFKMKPFSWVVTEENLEITMRWFQNKGPVILVISRFIPGSRLPVYLSAGLLNTSFWRYTLYFGVTVLIWTPIFIWFSKIAGNEILAYYETYDDYAIWIFIGALVLLFAAYKYLLPLFTTRGRRIFWKKLKRIFKK